MACCVAFPFEERVGAPVQSFSKLNTRPTDAAVYASRAASRRPVQNSRSGWNRYLLSRKTLSSPTTCRFIPAHPQVGFEPTTLRLTVNFRGYGPRTPAAKLLKIRARWLGPERRLASRKRKVVTKLVTVLDPISASGSAGQSCEQSASQGCDQVRNGHLRALGQLISSIRVLHYPVEYSRFLILQPPAPRQSGPAPCQKRRNVNRILIFSAGECLVVAAAPRHRGYQPSYSSRRQGSRAPHK